MPEFNLYSVTIVLRAPTTLSDASAEVAIRQIQMRVDNFVKDLKSEFPYEVVART